MRAEAEARFALAPPAANAHRPTPDLLHELQVHQIELEMQNDELRRDQLEIEKAHERLVDLYDFAPVGYVTLDPAGLITGANLTAAGLLGRARGSLVGRRFPGLVASRDADRWHLFFSKLVTHDERAACRVALTRGEESTFDAHLACERRSGDAGPQVRIVLTDVSEFAQVEQALHETKERLSYVLDGSNDGFWDWDIPLAAELADQGLALEVVREVRARLDDSAPLDRKAEATLLGNVVEALEDAQEGGKRIARIVKDLATFGRPGSKGAHVRVIDIVNGALRWLPPTIGQTASIQVENGGAPDITASPGQIEQVLVNMVTNAVQATPAGKRDTVIVRIGPGEPGMARLEVIDHGAGIETAALERIFEPFFTTRPTGAGRGTGLGLAISHAIVTAHGGTITARSDPAKGSTFRVELPAATAER